MKKIYIRDMKCSIGIPEEKWKASEISKNACFEIPENLSSTLQEELCQFIAQRGDTLCLYTMREEFWRFRAVCRFLSERHEDLSSLSALPLQDLIFSMKVWMVQNGYQLTRTCHCTMTDTIRTWNSKLLTYFEAVCRSVNAADELPETDKDVWDLTKLGFPVRISPVCPEKTLSFKGIGQDMISKECKMAIAMSIRYLSISTIRSQIKGMRRLSIFLKKEYPAVTSIKDLNRDMIEEYLIYLNTSVTGIKSFRSELAHLKSLIDTIALCLDEPPLKHLFLPGDITSRDWITGFAAYSKEEMKMWNEAFLSLPKQVARALVIHQMLGNRISETLTLTQDCLCMRGGHRKVKVFQHKKQNTVYKPAGDQVSALIEKAISETNDRYGKRKYVFVSSRDPERPMSYDTVKYQLMKMIREKDLRDGNGKLYGVGTHAFRHTLGQRLTQMHYDDETIADLLGHSGTQSVSCYRRFGSRQLAEETRSVREKKDVIIGQIIKEWDEDEI